MTPASIYVLGEPEDVDVLWLTVALRARGHEAEVILPEELMFGATLSCRVDSAAVSGELRLPNGRVLAAGGPDLVVNRLSALPPVAGESESADTLFVAEEWRATLVAWLRTLTCPVLNPPRAASLVGPVLPDAAWRGIAHAFGIACRPWHSDDAARVLHPVTVTCVADRCIDPHGIAGESLRRALVAMASYAGAPLLAATFDGGAARRELVDVNVLPDLRPAGDELLDALEQLTDRREGAP